MGAKVKKSTENQTDIVIVGGGLAGLSLAALLGRGGVDVVCIDRDDPAVQMGAAFDGRTTAISYGSRKVLEAAGIWAPLEASAAGACPIETIQILDGESPVLLQFDAAEVGGRKFGWIAENRDIRRCLFDTIADMPNVRHLAPARVSDFRVDDEGVTVLTETGLSIRALLVVGADGRQSFTRQWAGIGTRGWTYNQRAIVCTAIHEQPHNNVAVEHFRSAGPFAILPMSDDEQGRHRSSVVWTEHGRDRDSALHWPQDVFDAALCARFPDGYGRVSQAGRRFAYPLGLVHAHTYIAPRMALIAEAAHGIHPIAGQGLNMGLRDVAALAELVRAAHRRGEDPGAEALLTRYQRQRRFDNMAMAGATDTLNRLFSNDFAPVAAARKFGLRTVSRLPFAKRFFMGQAMGAAGLLPAMIRDAA